MDKLWCIYTRDYYKAMKMIKAQFTYSSMVESKVLREVRHKKYKLRDSIYVKFKIWANIIFRNASLGDKKFTRKKGRDYHS